MNALIKSQKTIVLVIALILLASCASPQPETTIVPVSTELPMANMPNPASAFCVEKGYKVEIRTAADGSQSGVCIFPDGSECDEWAFYRGECLPGSSQETSVSPADVEPTPESVSDVASDGCKIYRNAEMGYSFHYPADATLENNADPLQGISIVGPVKDGESWPQFNISHPRDREEYRPPEGVDLLQWLTEHFLMGDTQLADVQIAGTTAIHLRHERSPQSYAFDRYYFVRAGQLFVIGILHTGDKEDWALYNHFLESFQFE